MMIQCVIDRDGDTTVTRGSVNYVFRKNQHGHAVCEVQNDDHARLFLRMGPKCYRPYGSIAETHARALKMIPKTEAVEVDDDGEVFEEAVAIMDGRDAATASFSGTGSAEPELFNAVASAEEGLAEDPTDELVRDVAARMLEKGAQRGEVAARLQEEFGFSADEAKRTVREVAKK